MKYAFQNNRKNYFIKPEAPKNIFQALLLRLGHLYIWIELRRHAKKLQPLRTQLTASVICISRKDQRTLAWHGYCAGGTWCARNESQRKSPDITHAAAPTYTCHPVHERNVRPRRRRYLPSVRGASRGTIMTYSIRTLPASPCVGSRALYSRTKICDD